MRLLAAVLAVALAFPAMAQSVAEPDGYRMEDFRSPVPDTVLGTPGLTTAEAHALWEQGDALFVDVFPRPPRPSNLPKDTLWFDPQRDTIPGSIWLPNTGFGRLPQDVTDYLVSNLAEGTDGDTARTVVFYCEANCWMSWNATRRAIEDLGYANARWYPDGTNGWGDAGHPLETHDAVEME